MTVFLWIWVSGAVATWLVLLTRTNFALWKDNLPYLAAGLIAAAILCVFFWPFAVLNWIGDLYTWTKQR